MSGLAGFLWIRLNPAQTSPKYWGPCQPSHGNGDWIRKLCVRTSPFLPTLPAYPRQLTCPAVEERRECGNGVKSDVFQAGAVIIANQLVHKNGEDTTRKPLSRHKQSIHVDRVGLSEFDYQNLGPIFFNALVLGKEFLK